MSTIAFLITNRYQIYHYAPIAAALPGRASFVIELRGEDFGLDEAFLAAHVPDAEISWVAKEDLRSLDGHFELIVCQTPVLPHAFMDRTLVAAQQYSLAKEAYQYGIWRTHAHLSLMYGPYSVDQVRHFAPAVAVGNPLFDRLLGPDGRPPERRSDGPGLYMPTHGTLSSLRRLLPRLGELDREIVVKLHHAEDPSVVRELPGNCRAVYAEADPAVLLRDAAYVLSDYSGAAYDALYARRPLVLVGDTRPTGADVRRLSEAERGGQHPLRSLAATWDGTRRLDDTIDEAVSRIADADALDAFVERFFVNHGSAGSACAEALLALLERGDSHAPAQAAIRRRTRELMESNRTYVERNAELRRELAQRGRRPARTVRSGVRRAAQRARPALGRVPAAEAALGRAKQRIDLARRGHAARAVARGARSPSDEVHLDDLGFTPADRRASLLALLSSAEWSGRLAVDDTDGRPLCAVLEADKPALRTMLRDLGQTRPALRVRSLVGSTEIADVEAHALEMRHVVRADRLLLRVPLLIDGRDFGSEGSLQILVVDENPRIGRLVARHTRAARVDWTDALAPARSEDTGAAPEGRVRARHKVTEVDVVYTWVDSSDAQWRKDFEEHASAGERALRSASNAERFLDREELRFSLRSVWQYAPFVRHVFLLTAGQVPPWLDTESSRITVVPHRDVFPDPTVLPTFNSHAIETCLHRIPGLSERFVYFNDDVFLGREATIEDFFTRAGLCKVRFAPSHYIHRGRPGPDAIPTDWAAYNATRLIERDFGLTFESKLQHVPFGLSKTLLEEIETRYPEEIGATRRARFRSPTDLALPSMFAPFLAIGTGAGVEWPSGRSDYVYVDTGRLDFPDRIDDVERRRPRFFCLNSTLYTDIPLEDQAAAVRRFLEARFPVASPFERPEPR